MNRINYRSYRNVENLKYFNSNSIKNYCNQKLISCNGHIKFIKKEIKNKDNNWSGKICEIGSGNGKLLYRLELENLLKFGIGFEISRSRFKFSKKFSEITNSKLVKILNKNFLNSKLKKNSFDLIIGVDIVFNLISANSIKEQSKFLNLCKKYLKKGGTLLVEVMSFEKHIDILKTNKFYKKKFYFDKLDPFESVDVKYKLIDKKIYIRKKFFHKNGSISNFSNFVKPIPKNFWDKLNEWNVKIFDYWNNKSDTPEDEYIVILNKK